ncbi:MAG: bifunctional UDP-3-O-[3-hydroxymyristoyl] N-acetylglucosamine deacetylase/3-hydroxyacyl-ACP dehydratase [Candidatus Cloacimonadaceae bacterium]|jgi:UDP-3-O-[3-hydroxymyristoyl] N-acetylglucosamine deacetylase/3-hydroxyacyl-[acyl-carrier-protein] dehydratase|nr:bifunctional UDP-3-O-[3-hydroxymyristoyl] N-acetylglucosamine deacetylase/3-hydroxyacyl-ACP dehydratase [Candidatus Cloacimonadota bacterium]MDX9948929.1 bifunctional UDP-3-O-[3-hydroxymyristoyl] N-acetylglucosamine deacetylase/3-hydroxyacyl-ACP dehydratase [Candidatus Syntrophosphaera sp.]NLN84679.1 bifunctional UDP-3-O-[3-hydroxymyristoyl] N-acetylglucosamine deacetylase/3-hydroxyacyl-ACP dehydratase [Candidatus Cloacimonadota bacterium]
MTENKHTIQKPVSFTGIGLHTGEAATVHFKPALEDEGIIFVRTDLPDNPEIPADIDHVVDISRGTTIGLNDARVGTIEHVLAAIKGLGIDNIRIEIDGGEVPVGDGSALPYIELLKEAGLKEQNAKREYFEFDEAISFSNPEENVDVVIVPSNELKVTFMIDYQHPYLGTQYTFMSGIDQFEKEFAGARTFCFINEIMELRKHGLIRGGSLENALVIGEPEMKEDELEKLREVFEYDEPITVSQQGILNSHPLRYPNEFVRHKVLDLLGDIALLGMPIKGHILAARSGHKTNVELVKKLRGIQLTQELKKKYQSDLHKDVIFDVNAIMRIIPHRYPFLLVDKIIEFDPGKSIVGIKNVTINEQFFQGHFPGHPIMPGVLIVEGMAQAGGIILLREMEDPTEWVAYFASIDNVKFRKPVLPGDTLRYEMRVVSLKRNLAKMRGEAYVGKDKVAEGDFMAMLQKKEQ